MRHLTAILVISLIFLLAITSVASAQETSPPFLFKWGSGGIAPGEFNQPWGIAVDDSGSVYVADTFNHRIQKFSSSGEFLTRWGSFGSANSSFNQPGGIAVDDSGNVYVADTLNQRIQKFDSSGVLLTQWKSWVGWVNGQFKSPRGIAVDDSGSVVYVADTGNNRIVKFSSSGVIITQWGKKGSGDGRFQFPGPIGIAVDYSGDVYVADTGNNRIQKFSSSGEFLTKWGSKGSGDGQFDSPYPIATDSNGKIFVGDHNNSIDGNNRIQVFGLNKPPVVENPGNQTSREAEFVSLQIEANDPDGMPMSLRYSALGLPNGLSINVDSGKIEGAPADNTAGSYLVTITVSDGMLTDSAVFTWEVLSGWPPVILSLTANPAEIWSRNHKAVDVTISVDAYDPDGPEDIVRTTYSITDEYGEYDVQETDLPLDGIIYLVADRDGKDNDGRVYTLTVIVYDAGGESATSAIDIIVLHDTGKKSKQ